MTLTCKCPQPVCVPLTRVNAHDSCVCPLTRVFVPDTCTFSIVYITHKSHISVLQSNTEGGSTKVLLFHGTTKRAATVKSRSVAALKECVEKEFNAQDSVSYPWDIFFLFKAVIIFYQFMIFSVNIHSAYQIDYYPLI